METSGPYIDELPTTIPEPRSSRRDFNPEETVRLTKELEAELDRRRRR